MLLKRYLVLAAGVLLFITIYIGCFAYWSSDREARFRAERVKFGVDGVNLTANTASTAAPISSVPATPGSAPIAPDSTPASAPASPATSNAVPDATPLIGPVPPPSAPASPASTTPDSNSAPVAPSSTMDEPRGNDSPFRLAAYNPSEEMVQSPGFEAPRNTVPPIPAVPAPPAPAPTTNAGPSSSSSGSPSTNTAPYALSGTESGAPRAAPIEASVIVLLYHQFVPPGAHVSPKFQWTLNQDVFESEMKYIHDNGYNVVPMSDLLKFLKHEKGLPPNSVVITIDDGYKSAIVYAAPILKKYGYPWTFFIYPEFITVNEGTGAASWNDLLALQAEGVDIESHSMTHPQLTRHHQKVKGVWHDFSPAEYDQWLTNETAGAKALLEQKLGRPVTCFAYPYGDYNKEVEAKAIAAGYEAIFTVADNPVHSTTDLHSIGRYTITQSVVKNFAAYLHQGALGVTEADPAPGATISNPRPVITAVLGYMGNINPNDIETDVLDFGTVRHDYDPKTSTIRLYLPRDLIQPVVKVNLRVRDADTGQIMVANWHFNYEPAGPGVAHPPILPAASGSSAATNAPLSSLSRPATSTSVTSLPATNPPAAVPSGPAVGAPRTSP